MDDKTANKMLWITEGGAKVARKTDDVTCPVLDRPERYEYAPQVCYREVVKSFWCEIALIKMYFPRIYHVKDRWWKMSE